MIIIQKNPKDYTNFAEMSQIIQILNLLNLNQGSWIIIIGSAGTVNAEITVSLKYLSNFWIPLEMSLINHKINIIFTWSANCVISEWNKETTFALRDIIFYIPVVTL